MNEMQSAQGRKAEDRAKNKGAWLPALLLCLGLLGSLLMPAAGAAAQESSPGGGEATTASEEGGEDPSGPSGGGTTVPDEPSDPTVPPATEPQQPVNPQEDFIQIMLGKGPISEGKYGSRMDLKIPIFNWGTKQAKRVAVSLVMNEETKFFPFEIEQSTYVERLEKPLEAVSNPKELESKTQTVTFKNLLVRKDVQSGYYPIRFKVLYDGAPKEDVVLTTYIKTSGNPALPHDPNAPVLPEDGGIPEPVIPDEPIGGDWSGGVPEEDKPSVPRVILSGYRSEPKEVKAGMPFRLILMVRNTSTETAVNNMVFTITAAEDAMLPVSGSSSLFVETIPANSTKDVAIDLKAEAKLEQKPYPVSVKIDFEDDKGQTYNVEETISVRVLQEPRIEFGKPELYPKEVEVGQDANLMFDIYNKGKSPLYNLTVVVPEGEAVSEQSFFAGTLEAGGTKNIDLMVKALKENPEGEDVALRIEFEDEEGHKTVIENPIPVTVTPENTFNPYEDDPSYNEEMPGEDEEVRRGMPGWVYLLIFLLPLALIILIVSLVKRSRRKKRQAEDEAEILSAINKENDHTHEVD